MNINEGTPVIPSQLRKETRNEGVSPVVGVMLMIVVVIIIGAVVSAFAGGIAGSQKIPKGTAVVARFSATEGLFLTNSGTDPIDLQSSRIVLTLDGQQNELPSGSFWIADGSAITPAQRIWPQQTARWGGVASSGIIAPDGKLITPAPRTDLIGKSGKIELFSADGGRIAAADFVVEK